MPPLIFLHLLDVIALTLEYFLPFVDRSFCTDLLLCRSFYLSNPGCNRWQASTSNWKQFSTRGAVWSRMWFSISSVCFFGNGMYAQLRQIPTLSVLFLLQQFSHILLGTLANLRHWNIAVWHVSNSFSLHPKVPV